jgi:predicted metal-binding membrane protein
VSSTDLNSRASGSAGAQLSIQRLLSRNVLIVGAALAAAVALAWGWLFSTGMPATEIHGQGMGAMQVEPWSAVYLLPAFLMWALMMVAMMLPSAAPMILLHARIDRAPTPRQKLRHSFVFALGYLLVWAGFSAVAALAQALLVDIGFISAMSLALGERSIAAALLAGAALYQLTGTKAACLDQCRSPLHFVMRYWSPGTAGALRLGLVHGLYCIGCCWALMLLLFVGGVMNLAWVAALAVIVLIEKVAPSNWRISIVIAAVLFAGALVLLIVGR